ncbi:MAG: FAD-dependent oxidoreductase [Anaerolineales bacterium]|nr:FAD-dependent oxidoreductase [Anaerolineales bacterium]
MTPTFDIAIIGAGAVGCAIARELARYELNIVLLEANPDVGMGTSKASTAIWHTGFDAKPGSLEARLMRRSYALMDPFMPEAGIPHERLGAILIAWNQEQLDALPALRQKAHENGVLDVEIMSAEEIRRREPHIRPGFLGGLFVPGEGILCTYSVPLACATQAVVNGVVLMTNFRVKEIREERAGYLITSNEDSLHTRWIINAAGLYSDEINRMFGHQVYTVTPRRGQLIVYDKLARPLVNHVLLPVPTAKTKGVLISPTVYGNILLGPTAEDLPDKTATQTTTDGLEMLLGKGREILPQLLDGCARLVPPGDVAALASALRETLEQPEASRAMAAKARARCLENYTMAHVGATLREVIRKVAPGLK